MQQWEYKIVAADGMWLNKWEGEKVTLEEFLNKQGREGWELVQGPTDKYYHCIFKRLKR